MEHPYAYPVLQHPPTPGQTDLLGNEQYCGGWRRSDEAAGADVGFDERGGGFEADRR